MINSVASAIVSADPPPTLNDFQQVSPEPLEELRISSDSGYFRFRDSDPPICISSSGTGLSNLGDLTDNRSTSCDTTNPTILSPPSSSPSARARQTDSMLANLPRSRPASALSFTLKVPRASSPTHLPNEIEQQAYLQNVRQEAMIDFTKNVPPSRTTSFASPNQQYTPQRSLPISYKSSALPTETDDDLIGPKDPSRAKLTFRFDR